MKIIYFGGGFVGTCSAAVSADSGHEVLVYDINHELIKKLSSNDQNMIESALFEKGLGEMIIRNRQRLKFTSELKDVQSIIGEIGAVFMCLPTPEKNSTGETNLAIYEQAANNLAEVLVGRNKGKQSQYVLVINKSTVPIEMVNRTKQILQTGKVKNFGVGANPEFLVEGKAIEGSIKPDRIVVGAESAKDFQIFRAIYNRFYDSPNVSYIEVNQYEAAAAKLLANFLLFSRLAKCFDVVGRVCESFDQIHFENIRKVLITDPRIGDWGFYNSLFAGGSCFIKDARSLAHQLEKKNAKADLIKGVLRANERQLANFLARAENELKFSWRGKTVALLGLAFKRNTNDIRNSGAIGATEWLLAKGVKEIKAFDFVAGQNFIKYFSRQKPAKIKLMASEQEAMTDCQAMIIATDWPQFREIENQIKRYLPQRALIMDGRRILQSKYQKLVKAGYQIIAVGSKSIKQ